ncbi:bromodomain testis-specific protein [Drosophila innubila]|uniref:bromodomain testis-specific protein n=1 Tax=Drosophila innubila TaxID=198719 RepID=UPI00148C61BF|nr:bromodomain testis-specific protein [Drosophila innubila]
MYPMSKRAKSSPEISACKAIMRNLFSKRYKSFAWVFYHPIDANFLGLYDYHDIVKEPMDLSTIKHRLNSNFYLNAVDFARDVRLIFYNTYLYTSADHLCYDMAKKLQALFEDMYAKVPLHCSNNEPPAWSDSSSDLDVEAPWNHNNNHWINNSNNSGTPLPQPMNSSLARVMNEPQVHQHQMKSPEVSNAFAHVPMSVEEDLDLHIKVQQLDGVMLLNVIHMIHQLEGINFGIPNKELEFDVRNLKPHTKRSILAYMASKGITGKRVSRLKNPYN